MHEDDRTKLDNINVRLALLEAAVKRNTEEMEKWRTEVDKVLLDYQNTKSYTKAFWGGVMVVVTGIGAIFYASIDLIKKLPYLFGE